MDAIVSADYDPETLDWVGATAHKRKPSEDPMAEYDDSKESEAFKKAPVRKAMKAQPAMGEAYRGKKVSRSDMGFGALPSDSGSDSPSFDDESLAVDDYQVGEHSNGEEAEAEDAFEIDLDGSDDSDLVSGSFDSELDFDDIHSVEEGSENGDKGVDMEQEVEELEKELMNEDENVEELQRLKLEASEELAKAQHALNQRVLWDAMLDLRLKLQAPQTEMNRFPQFSDLPLFLGVNDVGLKRLKEHESEFDQEVHRINTNARQEDVEVEKVMLKSFAERCESVDLVKQLEDAKSEIRDTLADLMSLQHILLGNNEEFRDGIDKEGDSVELSESQKKKRKRLDSAMVSIGRTSKDDDGGDSEAESKGPHYFVHSLSVDDLWSHLESFEKTLESYSEQTIDKWARKVLYASTGGLSTSSSADSNKFKAVNQNISVQVDQIMANRDKAIGRTRLKREEYHVLGLPDSIGTRITAEDAASGAAAALISDQHDPEIFDDGDFCQILLKEVLEAGLSDTSDPIELTRRFLALKAKRKVFQKKDRKPSKGKTLKYSEQPKLVAFMAPVPNRYPMHDAYVTSQLITSLFGQRPDLQADESNRIDADSDEEVFAH